jgi:hypothetical protein
MDKGRQPSGALLPIIIKGRMQGNRAGNMVLQLGPSKDLTSFDKYLDNLPAIDAETKYQLNLAAV